MKHGKIFLVGEKQDELVPMTETPYSTEDVLQVLLERYPDLLPGDQINPESPRRWMLVDRELGIPSEKDGGSNWSIDHLFLDQDGIPTFVECKRSSDTRNRREVVAQMLDYAANGTEYWAIEKIIQAATQTAVKSNKSIDDELKRILNTDEDTDIDGYWETVETNLREGRVRLIFVADEAPRELRRLVEFLNSKMTDVEVMAVEVKQFIGDGDKKAVVPRLIGVTEATRKTKTIQRNITQNEFLANCDEFSSKFFAELCDMSKRMGFTLYWGKVGFSIRFHMEGETKLYTFAYGWPKGIFEFYFGFPVVEATESEIRQTLLSFDVFEERGKNTLRAEITPDTISKVNQAREYIFSKIKEISGS